MDNTKPPPMDRREIGEAGARRSAGEVRRSFLTLVRSALSTAFCLLLVFAAVAPDIASRETGTGLSVGFMLGLAYVITVMAVCGWYVHRARRWNAPSGEVLSRSEHDTYPSTSTVTDESRSTCTAAG